MVNWASEKSVPCAGVRSFNGLCLEARSGLVQRHECWNGSANLGALCFFQSIPRDFWCRVCSCCLRRAARCPCQTPTTRRVVSLFLIFVASARTSCWTSLVSKMLLCVDVITRVSVSPFFTSAGPVLPRNLRSDPCYLLTGGKGFCISASSSQFHIVWALPGAISTRVAQYIKYAKWYETESTTQLGRCRWTGESEGFS